MAHLLGSDSTISRALVLQDRQITNVRRDATTGIDIEQDGAKGDDRNVFYDVPFSQAVADAILTIRGTSTAMLPPADLAEPATPGEGLAEIFSLVEQRAMQRFPPDSFYPPDTFLLNEGMPEDVLTFCAKNIRGEMEKPEVIAFKLVLLCAGYVQHQDCMPPNGPSNTADFEEIKDHLGLGTEDEVLPYLASLGVCLILLAVAKPFVSKVTAATRTMCINMAGDLKLKSEHLSQEIFANMFRSYISKTDLRALARFTINRKFKGWQWGCAYAARFGAGTSHLVAISTFIARFPDYPLWHLIPQTEITSFLGALDEVNRDPLYLFPVVGEPEMEKDRYRVSAMPVLLATSIFGLGSIGDKNWLRYENVPFLTSVGSISSQAYLNALRQWCKIKMQPGEPDMLLDNFKTFDQVDGYRKDLPLTNFVQPAGKSKSFLQRP